MDREEEITAFEVRHPLASGSFGLKVSILGWRVVCVDCGHSIRRPSLHWALVKGLNHIVIHCPLKGRLTR